MLRSMSDRALVGMTGAGFSGAGSLDAAGRLEDGQAARVGRGERDLVAGQLEQHAPKRVTRALRVGGESVVRLIASLSDLPGMA